MCMTSKTEGYQKYIRSDAWRRSEGRKQELAAALGRCRLCNVHADHAVIHVHHRTYERFGSEWASDLTTLCKECHDVVTNMLRERRYTKRAPEIRDFVRPLPNPSALADPTRGESV